MENGTIYIVKGDPGHISNELKLSSKSSVSIVCDSTNQKVYISTPNNYEYVECENPELASTLHNVMNSVQNRII
jgi:hypothetical protein